MLLSDFIHSGIQRLESIYPSPEARGLVLMLCEDRLGTKSYTHIIEPRTEVDPSLLPSLEHDLDRLASSEPVQYVLGYADFCGHRFRVDPSVLIPRPETELLVKEAVMEALDRPLPVRVLDLCTGSGCIAWSISQEVPASLVTAVDISKEALSLARDSILDPVSDNSPVFVEADILAGTDFLPEGSLYDVITSNPPYIRESEKASMRRNVLDHEPSIALFVKDSDPLVFYRAIAGLCSRHLAPGGVGIVEINEELGPQTAGIFRLSGFANVRVIQDFYGKNRLARFEKSSL